MVSMPHLCWLVSGPISCLWSSVRIAVVEHVRDGSTIRVILLPSFTYLTLMLCGVKCPGFKREGDRDITEPFAEEARFFSEARLLQRDVKVRLEGVSSQNAVGTVLHPVRPQQPT